MEIRDKIWIKSMEWFGKYWGCHQMPERSFFFKGYQLPVCARCTGIIVGYIFSIMSQPFIDTYIPILIILCVPMALDGTIQIKTTYVSTNLKRFISGFLFGYGALGIPIQLIKIVI